MTQAQHPRHRSRLMMKARKAKRAGVTREQFLTTCEAATRAAAQEQQWRPSELAMSITTIIETANVVWPQ